MSIDEDRSASDTEVDEHGEDPAAVRAAARKERQIEAGTSGEKKGLGLKRQEQDPTAPAEDPDDPLASLRDPRSKLWLAGAITAIALLAIVAFSLPAGNEATGRPTPPWAVWAIVLLAVALAAYVFLAERQYSALYQGATARMLALGRSRIAPADAEALQEASGALTAGLPLSDTLQIILSAAVQLLEGNEGSIMLLDPEDNHLETVCYRGDPDRYEPFAKIAMGQGIAGRVAESRKGVALSGPADPEKFAGLVDKKVKIDSSICVPLIAAGKLIGVLNVNDTVGGRGFDDADLTTLQVFADDAAAAIVHSAGIR
ncbi:MAG: hypothetical protein DCC49_08500 [Acidobacteria bacterium]|nr:MAG: hypothetical protein DCC49_08500 [Acidobacteriota bacterium]